MKHLFHYILALLTLMFVGCSKDKEEPDTVSDDTPMEISARTSWQCGRTMGVTRAITDPLEATKEEIYPQLLYLTVTDGLEKTRPTACPQNFIIGRTSPDDNAPEWVAYHDQYEHDKITFNASGRHAIVDPKNSTRSQRSLYSRAQIMGLNVEANTLSPRFDGSGSGGSKKIPRAWDDQDIHTIGTIDHLTTKTAFGGDYSVEGDHLFLTLGHVTALLRLHFAVDAKYDKIRFIDLKSVTITPAGGTETSVLVIGSEAPNETTGHLILPVSTNHSLFGYAYLKPSHDYNGTLIPATWTNPVTATSTSLTFKCTYDIYDKDPGFTYGSHEAPTTEQQTHRTRANVIARNTVTLGKVGVGSTITSIKAGHYYDLYITINPDYLYVLSDHDNQQMTIQ